MMDFATLHREIRILAQGAAPTADAAGVARSGATEDTTEPLVQLREAVHRVGGNLAQLIPATHADFWAEDNSQGATCP